MGADIYSAKYKYVFGPINQEHLEFIEDNIYCSDDGTYELSHEKYAELKQKFSKNTDLKDLFRAFDKETNKGEGHFSFRVFV